MLQILFHCAPHHIILIPSPELDPSPQRATTSSGTPNPGIQHYPQWVTPHRHVFAQCIFQAFAEKACAGVCSVAKARIITCVTPPLLDFCYNIYKAHEKFTLNTKSKFMFSIYIIKYLKNNFIHQIFFSDEWWGQWFFSFNIWVKGYLPSPRDFSIPHTVKFTMSLKNLVFSWRLRDFILPLRLFLVQNFN